MKDVSFYLIMFGLFDLFIYQIMFSFILLINLFAYLFIYTLTYLSIILKLHCFYTFFYQ